MIMNARSYFLIALVILPLVILSQELNQTVIDKESGKEILFGNCDRTGLEKGEFGKSFDEYYEVYEPDQSVLNHLKQKKEGRDILMVVGTWCSDSQEQVPKFYKILDKIKFDKQVKVFTE